MKYVKNYYKILGVKQTSSTAEIKKAYYALAWKYHPDLNPRSEYCLERFKEINEAYAVLGDVDRRIEYFNLVKQRYDGR